MKGKICKGIAGFYYVHDGHSRIYECKAKGIFRNQKIKPLPGDNVEFTVLSEAESEGSITAILPRKNQLIRPAVSNVDQALVVFALTSPEPNFNLLDRFLISMEQQNLPTVICFNKQDLDSGAKEQECRERYRSSGNTVVFASVQQEEGMESIRELLRGRTSVLAGPSGVGKSSLMNHLQPEAAMETGAISEKIQRGRHTTRHSELFYLEEDTFLMDTPGFTSLNITGIEAGDLHGYFPEFLPYEANCRFLDCVHVGERDCGVKKALEEGKICRGRYENYLQIYQELKDKKKY